MKRIIEIEESDLERIREIVERENKTALSVTTRGTAYITIAESKLYDTSGECEKCPFKHTEKCDVCVTRLRNMQKAPDSLRGDCISREALKDEVRKHAEYYADRTEEDRYNVGYTECACEILDFIDNAPTVQAFTLEDMQNNFDAGVDSVIGKYDKAEGKWIYKLTWDNVHKSRTCNKCGYHEVVFPNEATNFCPNCGADMRTKESEDV